MEKKVNLSELLPDGLKLTSGSSTDLWITVNILPEGSKIYSFPTEDIKVKGLPDDLQLAFEVADIELKVQAEDEDLSKFDLKSVGAVLSMDDWRRAATKYRSKSVFPEGYKLLEDVNCPAVLAEQCFVTNADDVERFGSEQGCKRTARIYYEAICAYFGTTPLPDANQ